MLDDDRRPLEPGESLADLPRVNDADYLTGFPPGTVERGEWQVERDADGPYRCTLPLTFRPAGEFTAEDEGEPTGPKGE